MAKAPAFQFYPQDFLVGTADMTAEEVGGYMRLLCYQWEKGSIPANDKKIAQLCGCHDSATISAIKKKFIPGEEGTLINYRLEIIRAEQAAFKKRKSLAGGKGAQSRWQNNGSAMRLPMVEQLENDNKTIALLNKEGEDEVVIKNGVAKIYKTDSDQSTTEDLFELYETWTDQVLAHQDPVFEQMLMREKMAYNDEAAKYFLSLLAQYPNKRPSSQQKFRVALIEEIKKFIKPKAVNGFHKEEKPAGPYIPPKAYQEPITKQVFKNPAALEETIKLDIEKLFKNENFRPNAGAVKLAHLRKKKVIDLSEKQIAEYKELATGERIRNLNEDFGNLDNKKLLRDHAAGKLTDHEVGIINVISQELAYIEFLKSEVEKIKETAISE